MKYICTSFLFYCALYVGLVIFASKDEVQVISDYGLLLYQTPYQLHRHWYKLVSAYGNCF